MIWNLWLFPLGIAVGAIGTLIGAGGGFLLVPILILLYPNERPETITSISLTVVFLNALSGSIAYSRLKRIDYRSGLVFAACAIPGAVLGAMATSHLPRRLFDAILGAVLLMSGIALLFVNVRSGRDPVSPAPGRSHRVVVEANGTRHVYSYRPAVGIVVSFCVGFASSLLGIGGGVIHVPALIYLLTFPAHIATATSHFVLAFAALAGVIVHLATGAFTHGIRRATLLGTGALLGAQVGARLSERVRGIWIVRGLAAALILVSIRILLATW